MIASGQQPQITIDPTGIQRIIYGKEDKIYCATSVDNGISFPDIQLIGEVSDMHLGMSRGPQVASSKNYTLVTAMDKSGGIHSFQLNHQSGEWLQTAQVNDMPGMAPEGLMSITADENDNFYAVWLDIRHDKHNKICFASTTNQGKTWSENKIVYQSPDNTVCECCKPNIAASQANVAIMFRNWLNGSRDLYLLQSDDKGASFNHPVKLGNGTWKLNGCPMDGGGLVVNADNEVSTVWQREGKIFYAMPNEPEKQIGTGRNCSLADAESPIITWQDGKQLKVKAINQGTTYDLGEGSFLKAIRTDDDKILCVWENEGEIIFQKL